MDKKAILNSILVTCLTLCAAQPTLAQEVSSFDDKTNLSNVSAQ